MSTIEHEAPAASVDRALARAVLYRFAGQGFRHPDADWLAGWRALARAVPESLAVCAEEGGATGSLRAAFDELLAHPIDLGRIISGHAHALGHTPRAAATPYETEWSRSAGDLLQFHQLSDIAAFYAAFGMEVGGSCGERADHISIETEFLHFLCVKEAWAEEQGLDDLARICRETQRKFVAEHLSAWAPGLCARIEQMDPGGFYARAASLLRAWVEEECRRLEAGSSETILEPPPTCFHPEEACFSCYQASSCVPEAHRSGADDQDRP